MEHDPQWRNVLLGQTSHMQVHWSHLRTLISCGNLVILLETRIFIFKTIFESSHRSQEVPDGWKMVNSTHIFK